MFLFGLRFRLKPYLGRAERFPKLDNPPDKVEARPLDESFFRRGYGKREKQRGHQKQPQW